MGMTKTTTKQHETLVALAAAGDLARSVILDRARVLALARMGLVRPTWSHRNLAAAVLTDAGRARVTEADLAAFADRVAARAARIVALRAAGRDANGEPLRK
jgi:hypothetical protein